MARPSAAMAEKQPSVSNETTTKQRIVVAGLGRTGVDYACAFAMHPFAEVVGLVEPRGDLRRFVRGVGFGAPSESSLERWLDVRSSYWSTRVRVWRLRRYPTCVSRLVCFAARWCGGCRRNNFVMR